MPVAGQPLACGVGEQRKDDAPGLAWQLRQGSYVRVAEQPACRIETALPARLACVPEEQRLSGDTGGGEQGASNR